jgi:hypothetical protein
MGSWPKWKDLKKSAKIDPAKAEELRRGIENGRRGIAARLAGPAQHLRTVGQEFTAGLTTPDPSERPVADEPDKTPEA